MKGAFLKVSAQVISALCITYGITIVYQAATGASNPVACSPTIIIGQICVLRFCLWLWGIFQLLATLLLALCLWDCSRNPEGQDPGCGERCWVFYGLYTQLNLLMLVVFCSNLIP